MQPAIKTQVMDDEERLINSLESAHRVEPDDPTGKDTARQEFGLEADINYLVSSFTPGSPLRPYSYGEVDYTMDLQQAYGAIALARHMHAQLPQELRDKYPTWQALLNAVETGEFRGEILDRAQRERAPEGAPDSQPNTATPGQRQVDGVSLSDTATETPSRPTSRRSTHRSSEE